MTTIRERMMKKEAEMIAEATASSPEGFLDLDCHSATEPMTYRQLRQKDPEAFAALSRSKSPIAEHILRYLVAEGGAFEDADDSLVIPFGKYKGKTVSELLVEDARYLYWLSGEEPVSYFARQLRAVMDRLPVQDEMLPFGKHKDRLFSQAMRDFDYVMYWSEKEDVTGIMARFIAYVDANC